MATIPLLDRMRQDMQLRGLAPRTQEAYLDAVTGVATFCGRPPHALESLSEDELRAYFLHLVRDRHASRSTVLQRRAGSGSSSKPRCAVTGRSSTSCVLPNNGPCPSSSRSPKSARCLGWSAMLASGCA